MRLFKAPLDTCLDSPCAASLSIHDVLPARPQRLVGEFFDFLQGDLPPLANCHSKIRSNAAAYQCLEMRLNSLNRDMFKPVRSHRRLLG